MMDPRDRIKRFWSSLGEATGVSLPDWANFSSAEELRKWLADAKYMDILDREWQKFLDTLLYSGKVIDLPNAVTNPEAVEGYVTDNIALRQLLWLPATLALAPVGIVGMLEALQMKDTFLYENLNAYLQTHITIRVRDVSKLDAQILDALEKYLRWYENYLTSLREDAFKPSDLQTNLIGEYTQALKSGDYDKAMRALARLERLRDLCASCASKLTQPRRTVQQSVALPIDIIGCIGQGMGFFTLQQGFLSPKMFEEKATTGPDELSAIFIAMLLTWLLVVKLLGDPVIGLNTVNWLLGAASGARGILIKTDQALSNIAAGLKLMVRLFDPTDNSPEVIATLNALRTSFYPAYVVVDFVRNKALSGVSYLSNHIIARRIAIIADTLAALLDFYYEAFQKGDWAALCQVIGVAAELGHAAGLVPASGGVTPSTAIETTPPPAVTPPEPPPPPEPQPAAPQHPAPSPESPTPPKGTPKKEDVADNSKSSTATREYKKADYPKIPAATALKKPPAKPQQPSGFENIAARFMWQGIVETGEIWFIIPNEAMPLSPDFQGLVVANNITFAIAVVKGGKAYSILPELTPHSGDVEISTTTLEFKGAAVDAYTIRMTSGRSATVHVKDEASKVNFYIHFLDFIPPLSASKVKLYEADTMYYLILPYLTATPPSYIRWEIVEAANNIKQVLSTSTPDIIPLPKDVKATELTFEVRVLPNPGYRLYVEDRFTAEYTLGTIGIDHYTYLASVYQNDTRVEKLLFFPNIPTEPIQIKGWRKINGSNEKSIEELKIDIPYAQRIEDGWILTLPSAQSEIEITITDPDINRVVKTLKLPLQIKWAII